MNCLSKSKRLPSFGTPLLIFCPSQKGSPRLGCGCQFVFVSPKRLPSSGLKRGEPFGLRKFHSHVPNDKSLLDLSKMLPSEDDCFYYFRGNKITGLVKYVFL